MKKIKIKYKDVYSIVDVEDYEWIINEFKCLYLNSSGYLCSRGGFLIHREILFRHGLLKDNQCVDHINRNRLDNQKHNLRACSMSENGFNRNKKSGCSSRYKGVSFCNREKLWRSIIKINQKSCNIGYFYSERDAAIAYDIKAKELREKYCVINIQHPLEEEVKRIRGLIELRENFPLSKSGSSSKYMGVSRYKNKRWRARLQYNGRQMHVGHFDSEIEAARAYNVKAIQLFGEEAKLNII